MTRYLVLKPLLGSQQLSPPPDQIPLPSDSLPLVQLNLTLPLDLPPIPSPRQSIHRLPYRLRVLLLMLPRPLLLLLLLLLPIERSPNLLPLQPSLLLHRILIVEHTQKRVSVENRLSNVNITSFLFSCCAGKSIRFLSI